MTIPSILAWNCRGASFKCALRHLRELLRNSNLKILILLETKCSSANLEKIYRFLNFNQVIISEAWGFSGGIWILWDKENCCIKSLAIHDQIVTTLVRQMGEILWVLSSIYASLVAFYPEYLWEYFERLRQCVTLQWMLVGDYNQVLSVIEKKGGGPVCFRNMEGPRRVVTTCSLVDLGFSSSPYT